MIQIYDQENIHKLQFPETVNGQYAKRYWLPFLEHGVSRYIDNVDAEIKLLHIDEHVLPLVFTNHNLQSSYVASIYTHYISYAKEELQELHNPFLERSLSGFLSVLGLFLKSCHINRVVYVNNWLVSTNLYPDLSHQQLERITSFLIKQFPDRAIVFRSINDYSCQVLYSSLSQIGYLMIGGRQVYLAKPKDQLTKRQRKQITRDLKCVEKQGYQWSATSVDHPENLQRCLELYNALYIERYSRSNPQFTLPFMELVVKERLIKLIYLVKEAKIDGVLGYFHREGIMTTPVLGYDTHLPPNTGLYRMLTACLNVESETHDLVLHRSSGAANFKKNRGAFPSMEYNAVYMKHIPFWQRIGWIVLKWIIDRIAIPLIRKSGL